AGTPKLEGLIREHGETARVCRDVSVVNRELALVIPWEQARYAPPSTGDLYVLYRDLEFKALLAKLSMPAGQPVLIEAPPALDGTHLSFVASTDPPDFARLAALLDDARSADRVALARAGGDQLGVSSGAGSGIALRLAALDEPRVGTAVRTLVADGPLLAAHDGKLVLRALGDRGIVTRGFSDDTMLLAHLLDPARSFARLADIALSRLEVALPDDAAAHADAVARLIPTLRNELTSRGQLKLYETVELPLVAILARMETCGIAVDVSALAELAGEVERSIVRLQAEIYDLASETFNIGSPQQLGTILFDRLGLPGGVRNKTGWATGADVLQGLARDYPICAKVLEYREVTKLKNTYIDVIPRLVGTDGRLRTEFNQTTTATGRLSSTNPNLQNIPVRTELGRRIRRAFVAGGPELILLAADYSQIELRLMAHLSGDEAMRAAFLCG
ncbi:MAG: DNA polymerase, partial [Vulcanimicrobiaceae bacterium]